MKISIALAIIQLTHCERKSNSFGLLQRAEKEENEVKPSKKQDLFGVLFVDAGYYGYFCTSIKRNNYGKKHR